MARQRVIKLQEFSKAMLEADDAFADRVRHFERRFGSADADTLAILAQAAYFCWFECEYESDLISICRAIGMGKPTSMYHCVQVSPERWAELNAYVVGVQRWLGSDLPLPSGIDGTRIEQIGQWLGEREPAKDSLAKLFLCQLVDHLMLRASFSKLGEDTAPEESEYTDFTAWYLRPDGVPYATGHDYDETPGDARGDAFVEECKRCVRHAMRSAPGDAEELMEGILKPSQPPCMHRFQRYQDIKLASIGALKWRGQLPPDDGSRARWRGFWDEAEAALRAWLEGAPSKGKLAIRAHGALGEPTERRRAIVGEFLLGEKTATAGYYWLREKVHVEGATACSVLRDRRP